MRYRSGPQLSETVMEVSGVVVEHLDAQAPGDDLVLGRRAQEYRLLIAMVKSARNERPSHDGIARPSD